MARRLGELSRRERIERVALAIGRIVLVWVLLLATYIFLPIDDIGGSQPALLLAVILIVFTMVTVWSVFRILHADLPQLRAVEAVGFIVPFFLTLFSIVYLVLAQTTPGSFSEAIDHVDALYFSVTVFATVGFGDITPATATARMMVTLQMLLDLVVLGVVIRVVAGAARRGVSGGDGDTTG